MPNFVTNAQAFRILKEAIGIDPSTPLQAIVIEVRADTGIPRVFVQGIATRPVVEAVAGLFQVQAVEEVSVQPDVTVCVRE